MASFIAKCALGVFVAMLFLVPATSRAQSASEETAPANLDNPCRMDGDTCVPNAMACKLKGGFVLSLSCGSDGYTCCAL
jgi:hypothetical protein